MLRHVTVISSDGITLYHKSYVKNELDDVLFSALTGAIIAFTKELGDELFSIIMKKQMIYFKSLGEYNIVIFSLETGTKINHAFVIAVHLYLALKRSLGPVLMTGLHLLIGEIGSFDNTYLDDGAPSLHSLPGPGQKIFLQDNQSTV